MQGSPKTKSTCERCFKPFPGTERGRLIDGRRICSICREEMQIDLQRKEESKLAEAKKSQTKIIGILQACGEGRVLANIVYRKPGDDWVTERNVEPYRFTMIHGGGLIVETWQSDPHLDDPAWRNFRIDRIVKAVATPQAFLPRQAITLHTGEVTPFVMDDDETRSVSVSAETPLQRYATRLSSVLSHLDVTSIEAGELGAIAKELHQDQIRAAHGRFYAAALAEICADGRVTQDEIDKLTAIRIWLNELGWSP